VGKAWGQGKGASFLPKKAILDHWDKHCAGTGNHDPREGALEVSQGAAVGRRHLARTPACPSFGCFVSHMQLGLLGLTMRPWAHQKSHAALSSRSGSCGWLGGCSMILTLAGLRLPPVELPRTASVWLTAWAIHLAPNHESHKWHVPLSGRFYERGPCSCRVAISTCRCLTLNSSSFSTITSCARSERRT
jgi:hypothetical protein